MRNSWVDFRAVKAAVSMEMALANYGVMLRRLDGTYLRGRCPLPEHQSKNSHRSFIVNTEKNAWACHSSSCVAGREGRLGGNVLDFIASMDGCTIRDAAVKLQDWFALAPGSPLPRKVRREPAAAHTASPPETADNGPLSFVLRHIDLSHSYLSKRGVDPKTARLFGIGYNRGTGTMQDRIVIPIHNEDGFLVAYAGRSLDSTPPKYRFPSRFRKSLVLFNLNRASGRSKNVIVVEGFFDCLRVHQAGFPCVVALMGCSLSRRQEELLKQRFQSVVLLLDGDPAGRRASEVIASRLVRSLSVRIVEVPNQGQPDQLSEDQLRCLCDPDYF